MTVLNIDNTKTAQQNLLDLVNSVNGKNLAITDVAFGNPQGLTFPGTNLGAPTSVVITGQSPNYKDTVTFDYDRTDIKRAQASPPADPITLTLDAQVDTQTTALTKLSTVLGIIPGNLKLSGAYGFFGGMYTGVHMGVHADPNSLLYCNTCDFKVRWTNIPTPAPLSWLNESPGDDHQSLYSLVEVNGVLWHASGNLLYAHSATDGSTLLQMDLNAALGITGANYDVGSVDANGLLYLENQGGYISTIPALVRINTATKTVHDQLFTGTGSTYQQTRYDPVNNVVWAMKYTFTGNVTHLVLLNPTTGAEQSVLPTSIGTFTYGVALDTRRGQLWVNDAVSQYRIRVIDHTGAVLATVNTGNSSAGAYQFYDPYALYNFASDEIIISDFNGQSQKYRLSRWNAGTMTLTQSIDLTDPRTDVNIQNSAYIGPPRFDPIKDTIVQQVEWQDLNYIWHDEFWAVDRSTMSVWTTRIPQILAGSPSDYTIGPDGSFFGFYSTNSWAPDNWVVKAPPAA